MESNHFTTPCPLRVVDDLGSAYAMGFIGSTLWNGIKIFRSKTTWKAARGRLPLTGFQFACWGGMFSAFDCSLSKLRSRDDHWNAIMAGAMTGGSLSWRRGWRAARTQALIGGCLLALIEGVGYGIGAWMNRGAQQEQIAQQQQMIAAAESRNRAIKLQQPITTEQSQQSQQQQQQQQQQPAAEKKGWFSGVFSSSPAPSPAPLPHITPLESFQEYDTQDEFIPTYDYAFDDREDLMDD